VCHGKRTREEDETEVDISDGESTGVARPWGEREVEA
jgi:hypothetical protein